MYQLMSEYCRAFCCTPSALHLVMPEEELHKLGETDTYDFQQEVQLEVGGAVMGCASDCCGLAYEQLGHSYQNLGAEAHVVRSVENRNDD